MKALEAPSLALYKFLALISGKERCRSDRKEVGSTAKYGQVPTLCMDLLHSIDINTYYLEPFASQPPEMNRGGGGLLVVVLSCFICSYTYFICSSKR